MVAVPRSYLLAAGATGHTARNIAVVPRIGIELLRTGLEAVRAVIRSPNVRPVPNSALHVRAEIWRAIEA